MTYKIVFDTKEYVDEWGYHESKTREFDIPFEYDERVWYCYKKRKKYVYSPRRRASNLLC